MTASVEGCKIPIGLEAALRELGVSPAQVLATAGLPSRLFDPPGQRVPVADYFRLWSAIATVSRNPAIGIELACAVRADHTEPLFLAILSAPDVDGALSIVKSYKRHLSPEDLVRSVDAAGDVVVRYAWPACEAPIPRVLVEAEFAFLVEVCRRGTDARELAPRALNLTGHEVHARQAAFFRCPIHYGSDVDSLVIVATDLGRRFVTFNPELTNALLPYLKSGATPAPAPPVLRVRDVIAERLRGRRPTVHSVAKELAMSSRALQRLLQEAGTSFRELLDSVRNEHARGYLGSTSFTDQEVAFLLGFEETTSFYRAFRSWNAMSPSEFRASRSRSSKITH